MYRFRLFNLLYVVFIMVLVACQAPIPPTMALPSPTTASTHEEIVATIPVDIYPGSELVSGQQALWYRDYDSGKVERIDPLTNQVTAKIEIGNPSNVVVKEKTVWVGDMAQHAVEQIDPETNKIVESIALDKVNSPDVSGAVSPDGLALDDDTLWFVDFQQQVVFRLNTKTKQVVATIPHIRYPARAFVAFGAVWVLEHRDGKLVRIDPATNTIVATIEFSGPAPQQFCGMCLGGIEASADSLWVPLNFGGAVARIDPATNKIVATIPFNLPPVDVAIGDDGSVWVAAGVDEGCQKYNNFVARIDPKTNSIVETLPVTCAKDIAIANGDLWVGVGDPAVNLPNSVIRIKPAP